MTPIVRLTILTQYFPPETGAPQNRLGDLSRRLVAMGHEVQVVTGMPNYPAGVVRPEWRGKALGTEEIDGVRVLRSWLATSRTKSTARQLATYATFAASSVLTGPVRVRPSDVLLWESPPLFLAPVATVLRRRLRARLVMNVSDLWPRSAVELGMLGEGRLLRTFEELERYAYRVADLVTCQTDGIADGVRERWPAARTALFPNGVDTVRFRRHEPSAALAADLDLRPGAPVVGYAGNFGRAQALEQIVDAARLLERREVPVQVLLVGDGPRREAIEERIRSTGTSSVRLLPSIPAGRMPELLSLFDVAVVPLADRHVFDGARPSKMFELFAAEVPLVYCGRGEGAAVARASGGAVVVEPERPEELAEALAATIADPERRTDGARRARAFVVEHYDRQRIAETFVGRLEALL